MNPNYIHTLTLYNCLKAVHNPFKKDIWQKRILRNCFYKAVTAHTENNAQAGVSNTYVVRIPESEFYLPYREWSKLQDEERKHFFTLSIGDIIIYGECEEEINSDPGQPAAQVMNRYKPDAFKITAVADNTRYLYAKHYRAGG